MHLAVFCACSVCLLPSPTPSSVPALYSESPLRMLAAILGSLIRESWAGPLLGLSHPCSLCYIWSGDFRFLDQLEGPSVHTSLRSLNPNGGCGVLLGDYLGWFLTAPGNFYSFLFWWALSLLGNFSLLQHYSSVKRPNTLFSSGVADVIPVYSGLACNVLLLKWKTHLDVVLNTVAGEAQIPKFSVSPGCLMVTCCANSRFICFLINQKECSFYFSHLVESMLFSFLPLQIGATQEKGCFNFCFWLVFLGWVSVEHVKTYSHQLQSSSLKDCKNSA